MMAPSTVNGTVFRDSTATVTGPGPITGGVIVQSLLSTVNAANSASTTFAGLGTTQTFGNISNATTIHGNGGTNVINVTGNITNSLIFSGTASDQFIVNIHGNVNLTGNTSLGTGVSASQVVFNIVGAHTVQTDVGNLVNGIVLATDISSSMTLDGSFSGELIGNNITLMSGAHVTDIQVQSVPEPSSMLLMAFGSIGMGVLLRRKLGRRTFELGQA
jgi:hypothetical protein